ncbi:hypothetical protein F2Q68_00029632 [Brassica cretica]|uniref:Uncharacterized protein n=1 Tax=Brassica cretica TaxID=69181 RepID=A0A8S9GET0_BRACR|nr:hypothetical protein F2Q68_00029632 [Brassica cretica]
MASMGVGLRVTSPAVPRRKPQQSEAAPETTRRSAIGLVAAGLAGGSFVQAVLADAVPIKIGPPPPPSGGLHNSNQAVARAKESAKEIVNAQMGLLGFVNQLLTITPLIGRSFTEICTLHGCYIPGVPRACIAVGNTEPLLINNSIFTIVPSNKPDVFKTPTTHATGYVFFSPRTRYEEEDDESEPTEKQPPTIWCHKDELYHDLQELGLKEEERIVITRMRMDKTIQLDGGGEQQLYDFELKGINLYCFTFTPETDLSLTRLPKKILDPEKKKKKKGRVIKDGIAGPIVAM